MIISGHSHSTPQNPQNTCNPLKFQDAMKSQNFPTFFPEMSRMMMFICISVIRSSLDNQQTNRFNLLNMYWVHTIYEAQSGQQPRFLILLSLNLWFVSEVCWNLGTDTRDLGCLLVYTPTSHHLPSPPQFSTVPSPPVTAATCCLPWEPGHRHGRGWSLGSVRV